MASVGKATVVALLDVFDAMHSAGKNAVSLGVDETSTCVEYRCATTHSLANKQRSPPWTIVVSVSLPHWLRLFAACKSSENSWHSAQATP